MKAVLVLFASLALVSAYCPNGCSGHGSCRENDKCSCYSRPKNNDPAWTQHDCSERTCPKSNAWVDNATGNDAAHASKKRLLEAPATAVRAPRGSAFPGVVP